MIVQKVKQIEDIAIQQRGQTNEILMLSSVKFSNTTWLSGKVMWHFNRREHIV